jgi:hypothetical protein
MVGYIEDATIGTGLRVRFDAMRHMTALDRAEFFYAKYSWYVRLAPTDPLFDTNGPGIFDAVLTDANAQHLFVLGEYGLMQNRMSVFAELPVRWLRPQTMLFGVVGDQSGLSDLRLGAKFSLMTTDRRQATALIRVSVPTGDASRGLGTDTIPLEAALLVARQLRDGVGLELQFGGVFPTGGSAGLPVSSSEKFSGNVLYYGIGPSVDVYSSDRMRIAPVIELVGWRVLGGFQTGDPNATSGPDQAFAKASDVAANIINVKAGARVLLRNSTSVYVGYGRKLTDASWYTDIFRVEYRVPLR